MTGADPDRKEWVGVRHTAKGDTSVSVTLVEGNLAVRWAVQSYVSQIKQSVVEARKGAEAALAQLQEGLDE